MKKLDEPMFGPELFKALVKSGRVPEDALTADVHIAGGEWVTVTVVLPMSRQQWMDVSRALREQVPI